MKDNIIKISEHQKRILNYIKEYQLKNGYSPSYRDIKKHFKFKSIRTVQDYIQRLKEKELITNTENVARSINTNIDDSIPIKGYVAAGAPIMALENYQGDLSLRTFIQDPNNTFALKVQGTSMINIGIFEGDYIIVNSQPVADNGDIVVAIVNGEVTLKRYSKKGNNVQLIAENDAMSPIIINEDDVFQIIGKVTGVCRTI